MTQEWGPRARVRRAGEALTEIFHEEGEEARVALQLQPALIHLPAGQALGTMSRPS